MDHIIIEMEEEVLRYIQNSFGGLEGKTDADTNVQETILDGLLMSLATPPLFTTLRMNTIRESPDKIQEEVTKALNETMDGCRDKVDVQRHHCLPNVLVIPHTGPHAIDKMDKEVIVDLACGMAVLRGAHVFAQGIMAAHPAMLEGDKVSVYSDVNGTCRKGLVKPFTDKKVLVGNGIARISRHNLFGNQENLKPSGLGIEMTERLYSAPPLSGLFPELVFPQNLPSILCSYILNPQPGETILDMCAAPGGKTSHIGILMKNQGRIVSFDKSKNKIPKIKENLSNASVSIAEVYHFDGTKSVQRDSDVSGPPPYPPKTFDRILVDAPCSALGQRPSLKNKMTLREVMSYPILQEKLLKSAVELLKPGGILVYSTCSIPVEENERQVERLLQAHTNLSLQAQTPFLGKVGVGGTKLTREQQQLVQRFIPSSYTKEKTVDSETIGFFIAKFVKSY